MPVYIFAVYRPKPRPPQPEPGFEYVPVPCQKAGGPGLMRDVQSAPYPHRSLLITRANLLLRKHTPD